MDVCMSIQGTAIALVEDDGVFREMLSDLLEMSGLIVEQYDSGEAFLAGAGRSKAACAVVDVQLGDITGIEMVRQLTGAGFSLPVIFMTGSIDPVFETQAEEVGCAAFLRKPFRHDRLIEAIMAATQPVSPARET
jgi:FixJ family two-component response regulator